MGKLRQTGAWGPLVFREKWELKLRCPLQVTLARGASSWIRTVGGAQIRNQFQFLCPMHIMVPPLSGSCIGVR